MLVLSNSSLHPSAIVREGNARMVDIPTGARSHLALRSQHGRTHSAGRDHAETRVAVPAVLRGVAVDLRGGGAAGSLAWPVRPAQPCGPQLRFARGWYEVRRASRARAVRTEADFVPPRSSAGTASRGRPGPPPALGRSCGSKAEGRTARHARSHTLACAHSATSQPRTQDLGASWRGRGQQRDPGSAKAAEVVAHT
jgi:hypothetical protein